MLRRMLPLLLLVVALGLSGCLQTTKTPIQSSTIDFDNADGRGHKIQDSKIAKYMELHEDFPDEPKYAERLARLYNVRNDHQAALKYVNVARGIDPGNPRYDFIEARIYLGIGNFTAAERSYKQMVENTPEGYAGPKFELGWFYFELGRVQEAKARFKEATAIDDAMPDPHYYLGVIAASENRKKLAVDHLEKYLRLRGVAYRDDALLTLQRLQPELYTYTGE